MAAPATERQKAKRLYGQQIRRNRDRAAYNASTREYRRRTPELCAARRKRGYEKRKSLLQVLKNRPCVDCGIQYPSCVMDFDHVRGEKLFNLSHNYTTTIEAMLFEASKCDIVCANCHRIRTHLKEQVLG